MAEIDKHVDMYYRYAVLGNTLEQIGTSYSVSWGEVSSILKKYKLTGGGNNTGNWSKGLNCGKYRNGFKIEADNGDIHIDVTKPVIKEYMQNMKSWQTIEDYYKAKNTKVSISPAKVAAVVIISVVCLKAINPMDLISRNIKGKQSKTFTQELEKGAKGEVKDSIKDILEDEVITEVTEKGSGIKDYFSGEYKLEAFKYDDYTYIGDRRFNEPSGICFKTEGLNSGYEIGSFKKDKVSGEYVGYKDDTLIIGQADSGKLDGWCLEVSDGNVRVYEYKKGDKQDKGIQIEDSSISYMDFSDDNEIGVWADYNDDWQEINVGQLSKFFGTWKPEDIVYKDNKVIIGDNEYNYDFDKDKITYKGSTIEFKGTADKFKCEADGVIYNYEKGKYIKASKDGEECNITEID